MMLKDIRFG